MKRTVLSWSIIAVLAGAACHSADITGVSEREAGAARLLSAGENLIECPTSSTTSAMELITPLGGVVSAGGTSIQVPEGALTEPTLITVTVPASNYMEVDISVAGVEHFVFEQPVTITLGYGRCTRSDIDKTPLTAWYIESVTKTLLEKMGGVDDKAARTVTFTTPHLSGYALAN